MAGSCHFVPVFALRLSNFSNGWHRVPGHAEASGHLVFAGFRKRCSVLLVMNVRDALKEEQRKYVRFEVGGIDGTAEDVG